MHRDAGALRAGERGEAKHSAPPAGDPGCIAVVLGLDEMGRPAWSISGLRPGRLEHMEGSESELDEVALAHIRGICHHFAGADEDELQDRPLFRVGRRRFAIFNGCTSPPRPRWAASGRSLHFLADPVEMDALRQDRRFSKSPHHGDRGWFAIALNDLGAVDWDEIAELLAAGYQQVAPRRIP